MWSESGSRERQPLLLGQDSSENVSYQPNLVRGGAGVQGGTSGNLTSSSGSDLLIPQDEYDDMNVPLDGPLSPHLTKTSYPNDQMPIAFDKNNRTGTLASSAFNVTNTIIGGGVLALPAAFANAGLGVGIGLVVLIGLLSWLTSSYLATLTKYCLKSTGRSYRSVAYRAWGLPGAFTIDVCFVLFLFGGCVGYVVIMGDILTPYWEQMLGWPPQAANRYLVECLATLCFAYPLCLLKKIDALKYTSLCALVCIAYLVIVIIVESLTIITDNFEAGNINWASADLDLFAAFPVITFAFTFHMQQFSIQNEMKQPGRIRWVVGFAITFSMICYLFVGVFGYLAFFESANSNILLSFTDKPSIVVGKIALVLVIMFSFPVLHYPLRESLLSLLFPNADTQSCYDWWPDRWQPQFRVDSINSKNPTPVLIDDESVGEYPSADDYFSSGETDFTTEIEDSLIDSPKLPCGDEMIRRVVVTTITVYICYLCAIAIPDISSIFGLVGATVGTLLVFIFPSCLVIQLQPSKFFSVEKLTAAALALLGVFLGIVGTYVTLKNW